MDKKYKPQEIEAKWQKRWAETGINSVKNSSSGEKFYCLEMFPYPSGKIHMGHVRNYAIGDVIARYKKMRGFNVLHPMGWDAFGMPAENAAINHGIQPSKWTYENIAYMKDQLNRMGLSYDWDREVTTCHPDYYRWNQWFFIKMYEKGLAYKKSSPVNWCETCSTVLANEQVIENKCWRCDNEVEEKELEQWFFKITDYADRLLNDCDRLTGWPDSVLTMQRNWIGRSEGVEVDFGVEGSDDKLRIFTTRPDTLYGVTFMCLAPDHPMSRELIEDHKKLDDMKNAGEDPDEKIILLTDRSAINPLNNEKIPITVANFVLMEYGTGAIMSVPAHDQRDFDTAKKYGIPIREVISPDGKPSEAALEEAFETGGTLINSDQFTGLKSDIAKEKIAEFIEAEGMGTRKVNYRLRDWGISRQRYWGTPIPMIYCDKCGIVPVPENDLPVVLPEEVSLEVMGRSPLADVKEFVDVICPGCGGNARRETDTMDTFMDSSWYFIRYCSKKSEEALNKENISYWMPVDQYIGGIEHAVLHLLYSRFFTKVLKDMGIVDIDEPFTNLLTQGMVCKETIKCPDHGWLFQEEAENAKCKQCGSEIQKGRVEKMSKSKKNVIDPEHLIRDYGADTSRLFSLFAAPPEKDLEWSEQGVDGAFRFINRLWNTSYELKDQLRASTENMDTDSALLRKTHRTIKKVTGDIERAFHFNTAIAAMMELLNEVVSVKAKGSKVDTGIGFTLRTLILLIAPFAPHVAEELWHGSGESGSVFEQRWPEWNDELAVANEVELVVQVNGKVRAKIMVTAGLEDEELKEIALSDQKTKEFIGDKEIKKVIVVKGKLVSIVI
ncbi:MAG: leucine--tRNA ligase [Nitrospirota bacterium]|nr:MAG: leucine--tRNA ligase [Nitrospirota bacterium]